MSGSVSVPWYCHDPMTNHVHKTHVVFLQAATKLWPRLCFYSCLWFCPPGGLPQCMLGYPPRRHPQEQTPPGSRHPWEQTPPGSRHPPSRHPLEQTPPEQTPPRSRHLPSGHPQEQTPLPRADTPWEQTPPGTDTPQEQTPIPQEHTAPPPESRLQHAVNERPVCILLECILVTTLADPGGP